MEDTLWDQNDDIINTIIEDYRSIIKVDLKTGMAYIIKSKNNVSSCKKKMLWEEYLKQEVAFETYKDDLVILWQMTLDNLKSYYTQHTSLFPLEMRSISNKSSVYDWIKVTASPISNSKEELLITTKITNEDHMLHKIIDLHVYNNLDYFVLLDINHNAYTMFSGNSQTPLPPQSGEDYESEVKRYNDTFCVSEEKDIVTENMKLSKVISELKKNNVYGFSAGFFDLQNQYRRSRIQFSYYDEAAGLVVITRTDVTQLYLEEREKEKKLANALREAKHDPMTNLYNNKATSELIENALTHQYRSQAVMLFIDIDNFKLVNDTLGHQNGDEIISFIAKKLINIASKDGIAGRIGGDEFLLFLPVNVDMDEIKKYAQEICNILQQCSVVGIQHLPVSCSAGISVYPQDGTTYKELLNKSDQALYDAKRHGKQRYSFYSNAIQNKRGFSYKAI